MVRATLALLALVPCALASSSFDGLRSIKKRQTLSGDATQQVQGLLALAQQVLSDAQTGNITSACTSWTGSLSQCETTAGQNQVALVSCACASSTISQLDSCATSYGTTGTNAASGFESFCSNTLPSIAQTGLTSFVGASSTSAAAAAGSASSSGTASVTSGLASSVQSALSSSASSILSAASSAASSAQSSTPSTGGSSGTSAAAKTSIIGGGALALAASLVAAAAFV